MNWLELSYAYIFSCIQNQKRLQGIDKCLHKDTHRPYEFIEEHFSKYKAWPTPDHYKEKFNINASHYVKEGYTQQELADKLKSEYIKDVANDLATDLQTLQGEKATLELADLQNVIQTVTDKVQFGSTSPGLLLSQTPNALKLYREPLTKVADFGSPMLDKYTGGIVKGQYTVLFGSVSEGKSTFARLLAGNVAMQGKRVLFLTLEEAAADSAIMTAALQAHFNSSKIFDHVIERQTVKKTFDLVEKLHACGGDIRFIDKLEHRGSIEVLHALSRETKPDLIILDQIPLFIPGGSSEEKDITKVTRMLKSFCQTTEIPMIALTQRLRGEKKRGSKDSDKADLDNIGYAASIGQDADISLYVHKTDMDGDIYRKKVTIVKNRKRKRFVEINYEWDLDHGVIREIEDFAVDSEAEDFT